MRAITDLSDFARMFGPSMRRTIKERVQRLTAFAGDGSVISPVPDASIVVHRPSAQAVVWDFDGVRYRRLDDLAAVIIAKLAA